LIFIIKLHIKKTEPYSDEDEASDVDSLYCKPTSDDDDDDDEIKSENDKSDRAAWEKDDDVDKSPPLSASLDETEIFITAYGSWYDAQIKRIRSSDVDIKNDPDRIRQLLKRKWGEMTKAKKQVREKIRLKSGKREGRKGEGEKRRKE